MAGVKIKLKVIPNAPKSEVIGWRGDRLTIKLTAPPLDGRANADLCDLLADVFGVSPADVTFLQGETSRRKVVHVARITGSEARERLNRRLA